MTEEKGLEEGQDGSPQPWTILPRGVIGVGPAEKLEASPGQDLLLQTESRLPKGYGSPELFICKFIITPTPPAAEPAPVSPPCSGAWSLCSAAHSTQECWGPESIQQAAPRHAFLHLLWAEAMWSGAQGQAAGLRRLAF